MLDRVDYPGLAERTDRFRRGAPHAVTVGADGARVVFRRSSGPYDPDDALWVLHVATGVERRVLGGPGSSYAIDPTPPGAGGGCWRGRSPRTRSTAPPGSRRPRPVGGWPAPTCSAARSPGSTRPS